METFAVMGLQWGDEGKAKAIDYLFECGHRDPFTGYLYKDPEVVVRYQGGANAGHTIVRNGKKIISHQIPSGITRSGVYNLSFPGVAVEPIKLVEEIEDFERIGYPVTPENFGVDGRASVTLLFHRQEDGWQPGMKFGKNKLGTTGNGIGQTYADRALRTGITFAEFLDEDAFVDALKENKEVTGRDFDIDEYKEKYQQARARLKPFIVDSYDILGERAGCLWLLELAQGAILDVNWGSYPHVTASPPLSLPLKTDYRMGVAKAYTTRVGEGPMPTELGGEIGEYLREKGAEYGATTGRPRRCGWLDAHLLKYAVDISQVDSIILTKLDVLSGLPEIKICVGYKLGGKPFGVPMRRNQWPHVEPVYHTLDGWPEDISGARRFGDLPKNAIKYFEWVREFIGVDIPLVSVGPEAEQTIVAQ